MQLFEDYQQAKRRLLEYFGNPPEYYAVNAWLDVCWRYDRRERRLYWNSTEGGAGYENYVFAVYEQQDHAMFLIAPCCGDKELVIFDKRKELNNAE